MSEVDEVLAEVERAIMAQETCASAANTCYRDHDGCFVADSLRIVREARARYGTSTLPGFRPGLERALHAAKTGLGSPHGIRACSMCVVIDHALPGEAREALVAAAAGRLSVRVLRNALQDVNVRISRESISLHRNEAHSHE